MTQSRTPYDVVVGFNYGPDDKRHDAGETRIRLPLKVARELVAQGVVVKSGESA